MRIALANLKLDELQGVYPAEKRYPGSFVPHPGYGLTKKVEVMPLTQMVNAK